MLRFVLYAVLLTLLIRAASRLWRGLSDGMMGRPGSASTGTHAVQMVRDPVCGTFVVPDRAVSLSLGSTELHFCSNTCRDAYRARPS